MAIEKKEVEYAKEIDDVMVLVYEVVKVIKEKGNYAELVDELVAAVSGADQIKDELKDIRAVSNSVLPRALDIIALFSSDKKEEEV